MDNRVKAGLITLARIAGMFVLAGILLILMDGHISFAVAFIIGFVGKAMYRRILADLYP